MCLFKIHSCYFSAYLVSILLAVTAITPTQSKESPRTLQFTTDVYKMLGRPRDGMHGITYEVEGNKYKHAIKVEFTGGHLDSVSKQLQITAETALKIGNLAIEKKFVPPGRHLLVKMALLKPDGGYMNTFTVRYSWAEVFIAVERNKSVAELAATGKIETIWLEYWSTMCTNKPPKERFAGGDGDPEEPEEIENPSGKDLSCRRRS